MSYSISTLLIRNLRDVFGENDPARRRAAIDEIYTEDCVFYDPSKGVYRGRDEIDRVAGAIKATHPDFLYQPITEPEESGNGGLVRWVSGRPGAHRPAHPGENDKADNEFADDRTSSRAQAVSLLHELASPPNE